MHTQQELISCLCVTRNKPELLGRAIACFCEQTYPNKELIIVYEDDDDATHRFLQKGFPPESGISLFRVPAVPKVALGGLRNIAVSIARGEFICQWDDDDWYHPRRLEVQYERLSNESRHGSILDQWLVFDCLTTTAYVSNVRLWEGSILCRRSVLQRKAYENKALGEDTATVEYLMDMNYLVLMKEMAGLYIYMYHGGNSWCHAHWKEIFQASTPLLPRDSAMIAAILQRKHPMQECALLLDGIMDRYYSKQRVLS